MDHFSLKGVGVALVTPFSEDNDIDYDSLGKVTDHVIDGGADYLVALGTTAETPTLSPDEKASVIDFVKRRAARRVPIVVGVGGNCTRNVCREMQSIDSDGIAAFLSVVPYYNKPTQRGIYAHYAELAAVSPLPIVLYNVPSRTGANMTAETTLSLAADFDNIIGVKEASADMRQIEEIIKWRPEGFSVVSGDDGLTLKLMEMGADGVISVVSNAFPEIFSTMVRDALSAMSGDHDSETSRGLLKKAAKANDDLRDIYTLLFADGNPAGIKCMLGKMGLVANNLRLPLQPVCRQTEERIERAMAILGQ